MNFNIDSLKGKLNKDKNKGPKKTGYDLLDAYNLLGLETFPVTYEEIREGYYKNVIGHEEDDSYKEPYLRARELIFENININPFKEAKERSIDLTEASRGNDTFLSRFKKEKKSNKFTLNDVVSQDEAEPKQIKVKNPKKKRKVHIDIWGSLRLTAAFVIVSIVISHIVDGSVINKTQNSARYSNDSYSIIETGSNELDEIDQLSLDLLERDGLSYNGSTVECKKSLICNFESEEKHIPIIDIYVMKRNFELLQSMGDVKVKSTVYYKKRNISDGIDDYEVIRENNKLTLDNLRLDGEYYGTVVTDTNVDSNITLKDITVTENGYIQGTLLVDTSSWFRYENAEALFEGSYNPDKNELNISTYKWILRPSLMNDKSYTFIYDFSRDCLMEKAVADQDGTESFSNRNIDNDIPCMNVIRCLSGKLSEDNYIGYENIEFTSFARTRKQEKYNIEYQGIIETGIGTYTVSGNAEIDDDLNLINETSHIEFSKIEFGGILKSTDSIDDEIWELEYQITEQDRNTYKAYVTGKNGLKKTEEYRLITVNEDNSITITREDVLSSEVTKFEPIEASYNKDNNSFTSKNVYLRK